MQPLLAMLFVVGVASFGLQRARRSAPTEPRPPLSALEFSAPNRNPVDTRVEAGLTNQIGDDGLQRRGAENAEGAEDVVD